MNKPKTYDSYKKDKATHKYNMTYEAHEACKNYEKFLLEKKEGLDYEFAEYTIKIEKVNGFIVQVKTDMPVKDFVGSVKVLNELF